VFQQFIEAGERSMRRRWRWLLILCAAPVLVSSLIPRVLIVVTVQAQQLPVAAIGWIVIVVMVFVMDGKLPQIVPLNSRPQRAQILGYSLNACAR